ncbi:MAG: acyltransferase [Chitinophagaceae bacterium]|nr:acyltransferase [Chitinophagaceae bacterium]
MNSVFHVKGLNGIRAIAAFSVVAAHIIHGLEFFGLPKREGLEWADEFFTLSGSDNILKSKEKFKDISIRKFYVRRILRIWPLYFFYLIVSLVLLYFLSGYEITGNVLFYFFLLANVPYILGFQFPVIGHFWSLGVEEQFYLFWPWVVLKVKNTLKWGGISKTAPFSVFEKEFSGHSFTVILRKYGSSNLELNDWKILSRFTVSINCAVLTIEKPLA